MFNFKKIASVLASAVMLSSTMGFAAAANYPEPFVTGGLADVAVVYGNNADTSDVTAAIDIQQRLGALSSGTATTGASVVGEAAPLFTGGTKLYISDGINKVKSVLTKSELPTVLAKNSFSGNVDASLTQTIEVGSYPNMTFENQPKSSDDPNLAIKLSTSTGSPAFNLTTSFSKTVNFSHADSVGEGINLFGTTFTVSSSTDNTNFVLLKSAEKISLETDNPSADVEIAGSIYTIELTSASDTTATVAVTDSSGKTDTKTISEAASKKINGLTVAVTNADETNFKLSATLVAGSEKITLTDNTNVRVGESDTVITGTDIDFHGGTPGALTKLTISVAASESDKDAIVEGDSLVDPVFGVVKLELSGFNIAGDSTSAREDISVQPSGNDKMEVTFTDKLGNTKSIPYSYYGAGGTNATLMRGSDGKNISVMEMEKNHKDDYVVVGNEDEGRLLRVDSPVRSISGWSYDSLSFTDMMSDESLTVTFSSNTSTISTGSIVVGGKEYSVFLEGTPGIANEDYNVSLNYPDSSGNTAILYPTLETSLGAKLAFYEPTSLHYTEWFNGSNSGANNLTSILVPNGADTYQTISFAAPNATESNPISASGGLNVTCASTITYITNSNETSSTTCAITNTGFTYNITMSNGAVLVKLMNVAAGAHITDPAIMIFEEKDDNSVYEGLIITTDATTTKVGVSDVERTWVDDALWDKKEMKTVDNTYKEIDLWGTIITTDAGGTGDPDSVVISYPDEQIYAQVYIAENAAAITPGSTGGGTGGGQVMIVKDTEVSSVASKNLVVVGGSCINIAAAKILSSTTPLCEAAFTEATGGQVGTGQYIIKVVTSPYSDNKVAMLVAGYNAADTVNAVNRLKSGGIASTVGTEVVGPALS